MTEKTGAETDPLKTGISGRDVAIMETAKAATRAKARDRYRLTVLMMILLTLAGALELYALRVVPKMERQNQLSGNSLRLYYEFLRYYADQGTDVAVTPPPTVAAERNAWAAQVESQFNHPATVFLRDGAELMWFGPSPDSAARNEVEQVLAALDTASIAPHPLKILGSTRLWMRGFENGATSYRMWMAAQTGKDARWGAIYDADRDWLSFFQDLNTPKGTAPTYGGPAWALSGSFALPASSSAGFLTGMRAFMNDSLIFTSPALDLSRDSLQWTYPDGPRMEFFTGPQDFTYTKTRVLFWLFLPVILFPLYLIIPFTRWYRVVKRLTEPVGK